MADISAIIMTKNEEKNIRRCLDAINGFVDRAVVIDCGSTDKTVEIARSYDFVDVYYHEFEYYAKQYNWGLDNCNITTKWCIRLDADEVFPQELCREIMTEMDKHDNDDVNGFVMCANYFFLGKKLEHCGKMKNKLMVFKTGLARIEDRRRDAHTILSRGTSIELKNKFDHYDFKDLDNFVSRYNWYATREAQDYIDYTKGKIDANVSDKNIQKGRNKKFGIYYKLRPFTRATLNFIRNYYFHLGFLDGKEGLIYHVLSSYWYRFLVDAKIYEYTEKGKEFDKLESL